jgi:chorismate synthase
VFCPDAKADALMVDRIHAAKVDKDTVGGLVEAHVFGAPPGLGSCADWRDKLDARLAFAVMGIQAIKAVEIGLGRDVTLRPGSQVHDAIGFDRTRVGEASLGFVRPTNNAGGLEGGMTNGQPVVVRAAMKPISTLLRGLPSVDLNTKRPEHSDYERSDVCAVSAASVVVENVVAFEIARAALTKAGGDSILEMLANWRNYLDMARSLPLDPPVATIA